MRKAILLAVVGLALGACDDSAKRQAAAAHFDSDCTAQGFELRQCKFLWVMVEKMNRSADESASANAMSGMAVGLAIGSSAGRR